MTSHPKSEGRCEHCGKDASGLLGYVTPKVLGETIDDHGRAVKSDSTPVNFISALTCREQACMEWAHKGAR